MVLLDHETEINEESMNIYVIPSMERHLEEGFEMKHVNLTWESLSYTDDLLDIKLDFHYPAHISPIKEYDDIAIYFTKHEKFICSGEHMDG